MTKNILIAHPHKHHALNLAAGCAQSHASATTLVTPLYRNGLGAAIAVLPGPIGRKASGYYHPVVDKSVHVDSGATWQVKKLMCYARKRPEDIEKPFDEYVARELQNGRWKPDLFVSLQDYLPKSVKAAKSLGIKIWSDQIINLSREAMERINIHRRDNHFPDLPHTEADNDLVLDEAECITVPSIYTLNGIKSRLRSDCKVAVIPYGVHPMFDVGRDRNHETNEDVVVLARANSVRKGGHLLLRALVLLKVRPEQLRIVILGKLEPCLFPLLEEAQKVGHRISWGNVPNADVPDLMRSAAVFVLPTLSESMSLACAEAMQAALPIITTKYAGMDYLEDRRMGILVDETAESLADALDYIASKPSLRREWGLKAREAAMSHDWFNYERKISQFAIDILDEQQAPLLG